MTKSLWKLSISAVFLWASLTSASVIAGPSLSAGVDCPECECNDEPCSFTTETCDLSGGTMSYGDCDECGCAYECTLNENQSALGWCDPRG